MIKQLPDKGKPKDAGVFVMEKETLRKGRVEYYKIMKAIPGKLV